VLVSIDEPAERARIQDLAAQLGLDRPIVDGHMRLHRAGCLFQDAQGQCLIHARFGAQAKPATCNQFPLVLLETEAGPRRGIDPCCYHAHLQSDAAPVLPHAGGPARRVHFDEGQADDERELLAVLDAQEASVAGLLGWLETGVLGPADRLPAGLASSWIRSLRGAGLQRFLNADIAGVVLRRSLGPAILHIPALRADAAPAWSGLEPVVETQVLAALRSLVYLRLCSTALPRVGDVALLGLLGAVLLAWRDARGEPLGSGLSGWFRLMRAPQFSGVLFRGGRPGAES